MSIRKQQVESTLKRAISTVLTRHLSDPRIEGLISVTRVSVSPDLREAYVYVSIAPAKNQSKAIHGLRHASRHIHSLVSKLVALNTVPRLDFRLDETLKKQADVFQAIQRGIQREATDEKLDETPEADTEAETEPNPDSDDNTNHPDRPGPQEPTL